MKRLRGPTSRPVLGCFQARRPGFTLLEVMIAIAFIGIALVAVIQTQTQGLKLADQARFTAQTLFLAREVLARTQAMSDLSTGGASEKFDEPLDGFRWKREIKNVSGFPGMLRVQVWVYRAGDKPETGTTLQGFVYLGAQ